MKAIARFLHHIGPESDWPGAPVAAAIFIVFMLSLLGPPLVKLISW